MKPKLLFLAFLSICILSCHRYDRNCVDFKTGEFEFETQLGDEVMKTTFTRSDSIEIEHFRGKTDTASVRWLNDCEYLLQKRHPKNRAEEQAVHIRILSTTKDSYTFEYGVVGEKKKEKGVAKSLR